MVILPDAEPWTIPWARGPSIVAATLDSLSVMSSTLAECAVTLPTKPFPESDVLPAIGVAPTTASSRAMPSAEPLSIKTHDSQRVGALPTTAATLKVVPIGKIVESWKSSSPLKRAFS